MKEIVLKPVEIYENHMLIDVFDYTYPIYETKGALNPSRGVNKSELPLMPRPKAGYGDPMKKGKPKLRKRMTIDVDYSAYDISGLKDQCPTIDDALEYYKEYIYKLVRIRILDDWHAESGLDEALDTIREKIAKYYHD